MLALEREVVAEVGVDHWRRRIERGLRIGNRRQFFVRDLYALAGIFRQRARAGHHGADGLALPARAVDRDRMLRRRFDALEMGQHPDPWAHHFGQFRAR